MRVPDSLSAVVATTPDGLMGRDGTMPWHCPEDLRAFKRLTTGHVVIMGRKTFDSIGRPLPRRVNIVLSREARTSEPERELFFCTAPQEALAEAARHGERRVFIIGGRQIYDLFWPLITDVQHSVIEVPDPFLRAAGDVDFPLGRLAGAGWKRVSTEPRASYRLDVYARVPAPAQ